MRPEAAAAQPWGVQVTDFNLGQKRQELGWLDHLALAAAEPAATAASQ